MNTHRQFMFDRDNEDLACAESHWDVADFSHFVARQLDILAAAGDLSAGLRAQSGTAAAPAASANQYRRA